MGRLKPGGFELERQLKPHQPARSTEPDSSRRRNGRHGHRRCRQHRRLAAGMLDAPHHRRHLHPDHRRLRWKLHVEPRLGRHRRIEHLRRRNDRWQHAGRAQHERHLHHQLRPWQRKRQRHLDRAHVRVRLGSREHLDPHGRWPGHWQPRRAHAGQTGQQRQLRHRDWRRQEMAKRHGERPLPRALRDERRLHDAGRTGAVRLDGRLLDARRLPQLGR